MTTVDSARREWAEGHRRFLREASDPRQLAQQEVQTVKQIEELVAEEQYEIYFNTDTRTYFWNPDITNYRPTVWFPYTHLMKAWRDKA